MQIANVLHPSCVVLDLDAGDKEQILRSLAEPVAALRSDVDHDRLVSVLLEREQASSTAIADGIAIPHGKIPLGEEVIAAFGRSSSGVDFDAVDGQPTRLFFLLVSPDSHPSLHLRWLAHIASLLKSRAFRDDLLAAGSATEVLERIGQEEQARSSEA